ncbi:MAG TPA: PTS transporter subunit EIIC [Bacillota bacterium]|nr:PTS transporter subunit EIIC [Bacillota bacterium]HPJ85670.1 PTS transporter subunit EIIC [Bacillota bacterium]HPQ61693.1 PTS transporter subunit EIIC [Bacillota bacterium]HRX92367.1 PTS transporter subunit EIIC [Candidatus Izemoplasmatales bacterium]
MDYKELASAIVLAVGGEDNIVNVAHCATRLRFVLKDTEKFNEEALKKIDGVINTMSFGGQYQVIIGPHAKDVFPFMPSKGKGEKKEKSDKKKGFKHVLASIAEFLSASIGVAIIPLIGAGMIKAILTMLIQFGWLGTDNNTYIVLYFAADAIWYFIPVFLAIGAARKLGSDPILAVLMACIMLSPTFVSYVNAGTPLTIFGLPITLTTYGQSFLPILLTVYVMSLLEKALKKYIPSGAQMLLVPVLIILIMTPVALVLTGPLTNWVAILIAKPLEAISDYTWILVMILAALMPILIMFGLHGAIVTFIILTWYVTVGYDPVFMVAALCAHISIGTTAIVVGIKTKNRVMRSTAYSSGVTMLIGNVSEPAIFGVLLRSKKALITTCISAGITGLYAGLMGVKCYVIAGASWLFMPLFIGDGSTWFAVISTVILATILSGVLAFIFYKDPADLAKNPETENA